MIAARRNLATAGFTLIETLVVLAISVGLITLMTQLFRSVGEAAVSLRTSNTEWIFQDQLRRQLQSAFTFSNQMAITGNEREIQFLSWRSATTGFDGPPVLAEYRYDPTARALYYQERPLSSWWSNPQSLTEMTAAGSEGRPKKIMSGVENFTFAFIAPNAPNLDSDHWRSVWRQTLPPKLVLVRFTKGGRNHELWFDWRSIDA